MLTQLVTIIATMDTSRLAPRVRHIKGLTLIELLVTLAIAAILSTLAAPSIKEFIVRSRMTNVANEFSGAVLRARNEAVSHNICTSMCMSSTAADSSPKCVASGEDWQQGWVVFMNPTCDSSTVQPDSENLLLTRVSNDESIHLKSSDATYFMFNARGNPAVSATQIFKLTYGIGDTDSMTQRFGQNICLDGMGRTRSIPRDKTCASYK